MGVEGVILPTALFSTHTLFPDFKKISLSEQMMAFAEQWKNNGIKFDAIYTGYLGSIEEIDTVLALVDIFRDENTLVFVDPVMGDNGKLYKGFDDEYVIRNRKLCGCADIIVPNITEACMLTGSKYCEARNEAYFADLCGKLCDMGAKTTVLTGASLSEGKTGVFGMRASDRETFSYQNDKVAASFHGTGDLFASTAAAAMVRGIAMGDAFRIASDYTAETIRATMSNPDHPWYGVDFESTLPMLIGMTEKYL
jgi:pyridoxine kinase